MVLSRGKLKLSLRIRKRTFNTDLKLLGNFPFFMLLSTFTLRGRPWCKTLYQNAGLGKSYPGTLGESAHERIWQHSLTDFFALFIKPWCYKRHFLFKSVVYRPGGKRLTSLLREAFHQVTAIRYHKGQVAWLHFGLTAISYQGEK